MPQCVRSNVVLTNTVNKLWSNAVAMRTRAVYETGYNHFKTFLLLNGVNLNGNKLPPISEELLIYFVSHCFQILKLQYSTIKLYICGIRYMCLKDNIPSPFQSSDKDHKSMVRLSLFLKSVKRSQKQSVRPRFPITSDILKQMCVKLKRGFFSEFIDLMLETVCIVAFHGFLRCGEFTVDNASNFDSESNLCVSDVTFYEDFAILHLKQSKTDPFRKGIDIQLHRLNNILCPYTTLKHYLQMRSVKGKCELSDPLFINENFSALERKYFITNLKFLLEACGYKAELYNGHSFRIGAATSAGKAHVEDHLIKTLGRWSSDSYCRYIRTDKSSIKNAQQQICNN